MYLPPFPSFTAAILLAGTAMGLSACAETLRPAAGASVIGDAAIGSAAGVQIATMAPDFPGIVDIARAVTPMKIEVTNQGTTAVRIRYADFALKDAAGRSYAELSLYKIDSSLQTAARVQRRAGSRASDAPK